MKINIAFPCECKHYKGGEYIILGFANHSEDLSEFVVYQSKKDNKIWIRPKNMFFEDVVINGKKTPRFDLSKI